ncbi:hypothetical protein ES288_D11G271100v1 [Gossypium darwinii]|uniref:Uncharacterized protein n=1 Tax=Gossypium darwinii TaxID=34276 RepID=A0A5D2ATU5_GOSDA|nr:hypothetical protein ES288_D11G271100v1 [Gossypium darwinii]
MPPEEKSSFRLPTYPIRKNPDTAQATRNKMAIFQTHQHARGKPKLRYSFRLSFTDDVVNRGKDLPFWCKAGWWWQTLSVVRAEGAHGVPAARGKAGNPRVP